jgi:hypothetical protein
MDRTRADEELEPDLAQSKERLRQAGRGVDPLAPLRRHPAVTVATAAALGAVAGSPGTAEAVRSGFAIPLRQRLLNFAIGYGLRAYRSAKNPESGSKPCQE